MNQQSLMHLNKLLPGVGMNIANVINKQVNFIEPSPSSAQIDETRRGKKDFIDERFPPNLFSLTG